MAGITFVECVSGQMIPKTMFQVNDLTGRTVKGTDGVSRAEEFIVIGGSTLTGNTLILLDAVDGARWGASGLNLVAAVSNNALALMANNTGATCCLTSVGA